MLVISAFEARDSLDLISKALRALEPEFADRLKITFVRVRSEEEFIAAVNSFDGPIMIFDGHGDHPPGEAGHLVIGKDKVDITSARGRIRLPPIVILSACDTHAADRSSATVANAMLHLGARTVLATLLPIDAQAAATTFAQLIIRLGAYLPTACKTLGRVVRWNEVVGGMLRHQFQYDLLQSLDKEGLIPEALFMKLAAWGRYWSEFNGTDGLAKLAHAIEAEGIMDTDAFFERVLRTVPLSDAIRYTQLGNPETIWIGSVGDLPEDAQEPFAKFESELVPSWASDGVTNDLLIDFNDAIGMLNEKTGSIPDALRAVRQTAGSLTIRATQSGMFDQR